MIATPGTLSAPVWGRKQNPFIPRRIRRLRRERLFARISSLGSILTLLAIAIFIATHLRQ